MSVLEITLGHQRSGRTTWPVDVERETPDGLRVYSEGELDLDTVELLELKNEPRPYGELLGKALFHGDVKGEFERARGEFKKGRPQERDVGRGNTGLDPIRILLSIEAPELQLLHWERLCYPEKRNRWLPLKQDQRFLFSRYLRSLSDRLYPPLGSHELRALVLVASPSRPQYGVDPFDAEAMVANVREALGDIEHDVLAAMPEAVGPPSLAALKDRLTEESYRLLHLVAHGRYFVENGDTAVYLTDADGEVERHWATDLIDQLTSVRNLPHLVFLCACDSAHPSAAEGIGSLAELMVRDLGIPAVVAMTDRILVTTAKDLAGSFYRRLRKTGAVDRALAEACIPVATRPDVTVPTLLSRLRGRPLFTGAAREVAEKGRELTPVEIDRGLDRMRELFEPRAPVLLEKLARESEKLRGWRKSPAEPRPDLSWVNTYCERVLEVDFRGLALKARPAAPGPERSPFVGLRPFDEEHKEFFFGRKALVKKLRGRLEEHRFLAVLGSSGSGKSSLILAGLLPELKGEGWKVAYLTPGDDPPKRLAAELGKVRDGAVVVVADQFEELFTLCRDDDKRRRFLDDLLAEARKKERKVVITMRSDFIGDCARYADLREVLETRLALIRPMSEEELVSAMSAQVARGRLRLEAGLKHRIFAELRGEPGAMPLLQHALLELWHRRHGPWLLLEEYDGWGGIKEAIKCTADRVYEKLDPKEQKWVRNIFVRLTRIDDDRVAAEDRRDTRRRVPLAELVPFDATADDIRRLAHQLADKSLVVINESEVEVAHEALIQYWPRLRGWLDENRGLLRLRETVRREADEWRSQADPDPSYLRTGKRLEVALQLIDHPLVSLNENERGYLKECEEKDAERQRLRIAVRWDVKFAGDDDAVDLHFERPGLATSSVELDRRELRKVEANPEEHGRYLYAELISAPLPGAAAEQRLRDENPRLRLWIDASAPELHEVAWETLSGANVEMAVARAVSAVDARVPAKGRLRVVAVAGSATESAVTDAAAQSITDLFAPLPVTVIPESGPDFAEQLRSEIMSGADILYVCDAAVNVNGGDLPLGGRLSLKRLLDDSEVRRRLRLIILDARASNGSAAVARSAEAALLATAAAELARRGVPAILVLPGEMKRKTVAKLLGGLFSDLSSHGRIDRALAAARREIHRTGDWWRPVLFTSSDDGAIWYRPRFEGNGEDEILFHHFARSALRDRLTVFIGPGLLEPLVGMPEEAARELTQKHELQVSPERPDLAEVMELLVTMEDRFAAIDELENYWYRAILARHENLLQQEKEPKKKDLVPHLFRLWIEKLHKEKKSDDPFLMLAKLPISLYFTTSPATPLEHALRYAGKDPHVLVYPRESMYGGPVFSREELIEPSEERPLIYYSLGHLTDVESLALTESHRIDVLRNLDLMPNTVRRSLGSGALLFFGYTPDDRIFDWLLRVRESMSTGGPRFRPIVQCEPRGSSQRKRARGKARRHDLDLYWGRPEHLLGEMIRLMESNR